MSIFFLKTRDLQLMSSIEKNTFRWFNINFKSFVPETYKTGLIKSLLFQYLSLRSDFIKFHHEIDKLKSILYKTATRVIWLTNALNNF